MGQKNCKTEKKANGVKLTVWYTNADTLTKEKINELAIRIKEAEQKPDLIAVSEVKPKNYKEPLNAAQYQLTGYLSEILNIERDVGRGMLLYINANSDFNFTVLESNDFNSVMEEAQFVCVDLGKGETLLIASVYRSPNSSDRNNNELNDLLRKLGQSKHNHKLIFGDLNFRGIDWLNNFCTRGEDTCDFKFLEAVRDAYLHQHVTIPTRGRGSDTPSLIDLVFTDTEELIEPVNHLAPLGKSDHAVLEIQIETVPHQTTHTRKKIFDKGDYEKMREMMNRDWEAEFSDCRDNVEEQWERFTSALEEAECGCIPTRIARKNLKRFPLDKKLRTKIKKKNRLWTNYVKSHDQNTYTEYCRTRNQVRRETRKEQKNFEKKLAKEVKKNPKKFWQYANSKTKWRTGIADLSKSGNEKGKDLTTNDTEKAEVLSEFFTSVYSKEPEGEWMLPNKITPTEPISITINEDTISKLLDKLVKTKSPGPDSIHPRVLHELRSVICTPLNIIFQTSLRTQKLPRSWKMANVTAIYKKGSKKLAGNYRPVSLTSVVCKMMETLIRDTLVTYMKQNHLLSDKQFGFISGRSTVLQLIQVLDSWMNILDSGGCVDIIYCDFMKAFDKVPHNRLIQKLAHYGIEDPVLGWIKEFLSDRKQRVVVNGCASAWTDVLSGIPQGSVLGPILFVIYINSLPDTVQNSFVYLFADDTKVYKGIYKEEDTVDLQEDVDRMYNWTEDSLLKFHPNKCKTMRIGKSKIKERSYEMGPERIILERTQVEKDIGVFIDEELSFEMHMESKINKANSIMGIIRRTYEYLDEKSFLLLYKALVRPHLEYANQIWAPRFKKNVTAIENVQRRATKQLPGFHELSYEERLRKLNLPSLNYRRIRGDMIEMFKIAKGFYDPEVTKFVEYNTCNVNTRGHDFKLKKRFAGLNLVKNSFLHRCTDMWNRLPSNILDSETVITFEHRLDRHWHNHPFKFSVEELKPETYNNRRKPATPANPELTEEAPPGLQSEEDL
jgi:hypothetical protein